MPARPSNITSQQDLLQTINQSIRELHIRIDGLNKQVPLHKVIKATGTLNFGSIPANTGVERSARVAGTTQKGTVHASPQLTLGNLSLIVASAFVASNDTVTVRLYNPTGGAIVPNVVSWNFTVTQ